MSENELWQQICQEETLQACQQYMAMFPNGAHAKEVDAKLKILQNPNDQRLARFLAQYLQRGIVTLSGLMKAGLDTAKAQSLLATMGITEAGLWSKVQQANSIDVCNEYLSYFPTGPHAQQVKDWKKRIQDGPAEDAWKAACAQDTIDAYQKYLTEYPGYHSDECRQKIDYLKNKPAEDAWKAVCQQDTIEGYKQYLVQYPGRHDAEAKQKIDLYDVEQDWKRACNEDTINGYRNFMAKHPGQHGVEAQQRIESLQRRQADIAWMAVCQENKKESYENYLANFPGYHDEEARARISEVANIEEREEVKQQLLLNANALEARDLQQYLEDGRLIYQDLEQIFGSEKAEAIINFTSPSDLPQSVAPDRLDGDTTEVYFWGTPSSGKTCALGGIISNAENKGILEKLNCNGYNYMTRLSNIFNSRGFCVFPDSTAIYNIQDMMMNLLDSRGKAHRVTLVDLAGELFRTVYYQRHGLFLEEEKVETLNKAISYLRDSRNKKIHFFVVEYGAHDRDWEGLRMKDYLADMVGFLKDEQIFKRSTVGVYVLVTKCDKIGCKRDERPEEAFNYVENELAAFWAPLKKVCKDTGVGDLKVLSYSVGDVFAQKLCKFDPSDTEKVIDKLITKTPADSGWFSSFLRG